MSTDLYAPYVKQEPEGYLDGAPQKGRFAGNENYLTLVWRKFRRSFTGMLGLVLVGLLFFIALVRRLCRAG